MRGMEFRDEEGLTTVGMVLALLIALALVFSAGRAYRIGSAASEVQNVADAAALAAQKRSSRVHGGRARVRCGGALAFAYEPCGDGLGRGRPVRADDGVGVRTLLKAAATCPVRAYSFAEKAASGLSRLQRLLPFFVGGERRFGGCGEHAGASNYVALAVLAPFEGKDIAVGAHGGRVDRDKTRSIATLPT